MTAASQVVSPMAFSRIAFSKYSGAGNTFFLIDNRMGIFPVSASKWISSLCYDKDIRISDGIILLEHSITSDFRMRIFNADGSEAEMCGNGLRCFVKYLQELGLIQPFYRIETGAFSQVGHHIAALSSEGVTLSMGSPHSIEWNIPFSLQGFPSLTLHFLNTGVPHAVLFLGSIEELHTFPTFEVGSTIRHHPYFAPQGTNVNVAVVKDPHTLELQTFERGVEDITLACGTGAVASALAAAHLYGLASPLFIHVPSGEVLKIHFKKELDRFVEVFLEGPAKKIAEGFFDLLFP